MKTRLLLATLFCAIKLIAQTKSPIDVYESTLKVPGLGEESYMCGLAEGDLLIFNFEEVNGKPLKEIEIMEYPSSSKFMDYKCTRISNKTVTIAKSGIYKFRFANSAIGGRVCKFKIQRVPVSDQTVNFNTSVYENIVSDTTIVNITDQVAKVHSTTNPNGNRTFLNFSLPKNTVAWSYYVGVDQAGQAAFQTATNQLAQGTSSYLSAIPGYGPLAALALGAPSFLSHIQGGEDIDYVIFDNDNALLLQNGQAYRYWKKGKVLNDYSRMSDPLSGNLQVCLINDNALTGVAVSVKITAIVVNTRSELRLGN